MTEEVIGLRAEDLPTLRRLEACAKMLDAERMRLSIELNYVTNQLQAAYSTLYGALSQGYGVDLANENWSLDVEHGTLKRECDCNKEEQPDEPPAE